jgi:hypothetical protein
MAVRKNINTDIKVESVDEFFKRVIELRTKIEVHQACNDLKDKLVERGHAIDYISKLMSKYNAPFKKDGDKLILEYPELYEPASEKTPGKMQHVAIKQLNLKPEQIKQLNEKREINQQLDMGIDEKGEVRDTSKIPKIDINKIIEESVKCLMSEDPAVIACGILNLTGLRPAEQSMPRHEYSEIGIIEHTMVAVSDYEIAFRGVVKKRTPEDATAFYKRITLAPAKKIVEAQEKFLNFLDVQSLPTDPDKYSQSAFYQQLNDVYRDIFGVSLSTVKAYNDDGTLKDEKGNATPRKGRTFYACALRAVLRFNIYGTQAITKVVQKSLVHDSETHTYKYLGKYEESMFENPPTHINVSTNINEYGKMLNPPIIPVKETVKGFNINNFIDGLEFDENVAFVNFLKAGMSETQAVLTLIKTLRNKNTTAKNIESTKSTSESTESTSESTSPTDNKSVTEKVKTIIEAIMDYNRYCSEGDYTKVVVPSYSYINDISKLYYHKSVAYSTVLKCFSELSDSLDKELKELGVVNGKDEKHNDHNLKGKKKELTAKILKYIEPD